MLINELRDFTKDVPEKKIILDQMDPSDVSRLVMQIAAYVAWDSIRGHDPETHGVDEDDIDGFIEAVIEDLNRLTTSQNMKKALEDAKRGKI